MDLLELLAGVQEDVENAPEEPARWEPPGQVTDMRELAFEFSRLCGLDLGLQTRLVADILSGEWGGTEYPAWCDSSACSMANRALYEWLDRNNATSYRHNEIVDKLLDCLRRTPRADFIRDVRFVLETHANHIRVAAMRIHTDLTTTGFWKNAGEAMRRLQRNALSVAVLNYKASAYRNR